MGGVPFEDSKSPEPITSDINIPTVEGSNLDYRRVLYNVIKDHSTPASFAIGGEISGTVENPFIIIDGAGRLKEPVSDQQIKQLLSKALPWDKDQAVSKSEDDIQDSKIWILHSSNVALNKIWNSRTMPKLLTSVCLHFGIDETGTSTVFRRMLIFQPGAQLSNYRDVREEIGFFGTIYFQILSTFEGGLMKLRHDDIERAFDFCSLSTDHVCFMSYLKDSDLTMSTITSGYRIMLEYDLICDYIHHPSTPSSSSAHQIMREVDTAVCAWQVDDKGVEKFLVKLDHDYKPSHMATVHLKASDKRSAYRISQFQSISSQQHFFHTYTGMLCKAITWIHKTNARSLDSIRYFVEDWTAVDPRSAPLKGKLAVRFTEEILSDQPINDEAMFHTKYTMKPQLGSTQKDQCKFDRSIDHDLMLMLRCYVDVDYIYKAPCLVFWPIQHSFNILVQTDFQAAIDSLRETNPSIAEDVLRSRRNYILDYAISHIAEVWGEHFNNKNITRSLILLCDCSDRFVQILRICGQAHVKRSTDSAVYIGITDPATASAIVEAIKKYSWIALHYEIDRILQVTTPVNLSGASSLVHKLQALCIPDYHRYEKYICDLILRSNVSALPILDFKYCFEYMLHHTSFADYASFLVKVEGEVIPYTINHVLDAVNFTEHDDQLMKLRELAIRIYTVNRPNQRVSCEDFLTFLESLISAKDSISLNALTRAILATPSFNDTVFQMMFQRELVIKAVKENEPSMRLLCQIRYDKLSSIPRPNPNTAMPNASFPSAPLIQTFLRSTERQLTFNGNFHSTMEANEWIRANFYNPTPVFVTPAGHIAGVATSSISVEEMLSRGYSAVAEIIFSNGDFYIQLTKTSAWLDRLMQVYESTVKESLRLKSILYAGAATADERIAYANQKQGVISKVETPQKRSRLDDSLTRALSTDDRDADQR
jgi:hypothetical protein